jgi:anti-sigma B factor antagonist
MESRFRVTAREVDRVIVLDACGRLTQGAGGEKLRDLLHDFASQSHSRFVVNLALVDFIDSYGVGELVRCQRAAQKIGGRLKLARVPARIHSMLEITNLHKYFEIHPDEPAAVRAFV